MNARAIPGESRYVYASVAVGSIWLAVVLASIFSPDMVTGSEQEHLPIAAFGDWFWGAITTGLVLMAYGVSRRAGPEGRGAWMSCAAVIVAIWLAVALVSIFMPDMVTGTDPTRIPLGAVISPIAGTIATAFVCVLLAAAPAREAPQPG